MKLGISKSKNSCSFYVQKSIRKADGVISTVIIERLGNIDEVRARANGADPYEWAQEYVDELNRKEKDEKKEIIIPYSPRKLIGKNIQKSYNCGYLFLQDIYYRLGLDRICAKISSRHGFEYDLNDILSRLVYTRIIYPGSKLSSYRLSRDFIEQPRFELHDIYRSLSVISKESDYIQSELFKNSEKLIKRDRQILYYDCTNYYFEIEEEDRLRKYGKSKQHQPLPLVGMGLFVDSDGIPMSFDIFPGNRNEQPTLKPLEERIIANYGLKNVIVCTDAGLCSKTNRKLNNVTEDGVRKRSFITTQPVKTLPDYLKEFALSTEGWHLPDDSRTYSIEGKDNDNNGEDRDTVYYKDRWITEDLTEAQKRRGVKPLEQHLIVSFSKKYREYQRKIREGQIDRAKKLISSGQYKKRGRNQNDPRRFICCEKITEYGETNLKEVAFLDTAAIEEEARYDGFYAVCTNNSELGIKEVMEINKKRWQIEECFRIMKTDFRAMPVFVRKEDRIKAHFTTCFIALCIYRILEKNLGEKYTCEQIIDTLARMMMYRPGEKLGYIPAYTRTELTDSLHEASCFRTDYEITSDIDMRRIIKKTKSKN